MTTLLPDPTPRRIWCPIISADDHLLEPPSLFEGRLPRRMLDQAPHVVRSDDDLPYWEIDGLHYAITIANGSAGRPVSEWANAPQRYEEFRQGVWDPVARTRDMDINGVWASLCFPSFLFGFAGRRFSSMRDADLGLACLRAYNDWMLDEWCGTNRNRFIPCQVPWLVDPGIAADEIRRNAERGYRAVTFCENPELVGFPSIYSDYWHEFFAACEETETVVNLHVGSSGNVARPSSDSPVDVAVTLFPVNGIMALVDWIFARIPVRFPDIRIALSEAGVSWVPSVIENLERTYRHIDGNSSWTRSDPHPVDLVHRNFWFTSIDDQSAFHNLHLINADHIMVESDFPHQDSTWPDTQEFIERQLCHLDRGSIEQICFGNAARCYRHPEPPQDWRRNISAPSDSVTRSA